MTKVSYRVEKDGYWTICNSLRTVASTTCGDNSYKVTTIYEKMEEPTTSLSAKRKELMDKNGGFIRCATVKY